MLVIVIVLMMMTTVGACSDADFVGSSACGAAYAAHIYYGHFSYYELSDQESLSQNSEITASRN